MKSAIEFFGALPGLLVPVDRRKVREVFELFTKLDGLGIFTHAIPFVEDPARWHRDEGLAGEALAHRRRADLFVDSVFSYLEEKCPNIELTLEPDVETWIEANAAAVAEVNLRIMEDTLSGDDRLELRQNVDVEAFDAQQRSIPERLGAP